MSSFPLPIVGVCLLIDGTEIMNMMLAFMIERTGNIGKRLVISGMTFKV